ncbi:MAG TPA: Na+/H+ antiporter subunit E [Noviherbaspirillum sp.]|uniref:Na+/H+ antiporter subunit E n=1 Tax=Noviherbaspirillum sp. TaxID=1926288 RepID=UPI002D316EA1|nr:Na+/H+ antiporter subunit E [Noviherbaspirillum sp.]HYD96246.1 Na+/H+ antiporter subunit E [Noviherbaspirillum sp.]
MTLRSFLLRTAFYAAVWASMTGSAGGSWGVGIISASLAAALSLRLHPPGARRLSLRGVPGFLVFFAVHSLRGGVQVAAVALSPRLDLRPAMLDIPLRLREEADQLFLAGFLSLMPGTLSAGLDHGRLQLHVLDRRNPVEDDVRAAEVRVAHLFGVPLS